MITSENFLSDIQDMTIIDFDQNQFLLVIQIKLSIVIMTHFHQ